MMKNFIKSILVFTLLIFTSCQDEITELPNDQNNETITANSEVAELVTLTTLKDGSKDNIIDQASCSSVVLPVTVVVHGIEITIDSDDDLQLIEELYDKYEDDIDELDILFPIMVILSDHSQVVIENANHLENIIAECSEDDDDIECIDFEYPLSISVYNENNEIAETKKFEDDKNLYYFFHELKENEFVSFNFPMGLIDSEGTKLNIENNEQLSEALRIAKNECDEDDDNDYNDDDFDTESLNTYLVKCPFIFDYVKRSGEDLTVEYNDVLMIFRENGTIEAKFNSGDIEGEWETTMTGEGPVLALFFENSVDLTNEWRIYEIGDGKIKLYESDDDKIILKKRCEEQGVGFTQNDVEIIKDYIASSSWGVDNYTTDGVNQTATYNDFIIEFNFETGIVVANKSQDVIEGTWSVILDGNKMKLILDFGEVVPFDELSEDWEVLEYYENVVQLKNVSGGDGSITTLKLGSIQ